MKDHNRSVVVINKDARQAKRAEAVFSSPVKGGIEVVRRYVLSGKMIAATLRAELQEGIRTFIVGGGDGTMNVAVNALAYSGATLGIIPLGTTNNFARSLGLPLDVAQSKAVINKQHARMINLGVVNHRYFANVATIGVSAEAAKSVHPAVKKTVGRAAYASAGLRQAIAHQPFYCIISAPDHKHSLMTHELVIANGSYHAALPLSTATSVISDDLQITALGTSQSRWQWAGALLRMATRSVYSSPEALELKLSKFTVTAWPRQTVAVDGEITAQTPAEFSVALGAIRVFVSG